MVAYEVWHLFTLFFHDDRHTWPTYFSLRVGGTLGCGYRKTCPRITGFLMWIGCIISGDPIASSRMRKRLRSTRCRFQIIISGYITIRRCFICPSKLASFDIIVSFNNKCCLNLS